MSRRRSRLSLSVNSDREFSVDQFLRGFALRTPRNRRKFINATPAAKNQRRSIHPKTLDSWDRVIIEGADFILGNPSAIGGDGAEKKEPHKSRPLAKGSKRTNISDTEWDSLIGICESSGPSKKRRRKHYVVYNSLPLSRIVEDDRFQFTQSESGLPAQSCEGSQETSHAPDRDNSLCPRNQKRLFPVSVIHKMIMSRQLKKELGPTIILSDGEGGSGSACNAGLPFSVGYSKSSSLPSVPGASPILVKIETKSMAELPEQPASTGPRASHKVNDSRATSEKPLQTRILAFQAAELRPIGSVGTKIDNISSSLALDDRIPKIIVQGDIETCQSGNGKREALVDGTLFENRKPHDKSSPKGLELTRKIYEPPVPCQAKEAELGDSSFTHITRPKQQFWSGIGARPPSSLLGNSSATSTDVSDKADSEFEVVVLPAPSLATAKGPFEWSRVLSRQRALTVSYQREKRVLVDEDEPELSVPSHQFTGRSSENSYFSTAQRILMNRLDGSAKNPLLGNFLHSVPETQCFSVFNSVIDEEQCLADYKGMVARSAIPIGIYNLDCKMFSTPKRAPTTPVALKDLLGRTGRSNMRRPSISGIFRGRTASFANFRPNKPNRKEPKKAASINTGICVAAISDKVFPSVPSRPEKAYSIKISSKALQPFVSPFGKSPREIIGNNEARKPKRMVTMPCGLKTPLRRLFKPPLLGRANTLLDHGFEMTTATINGPMRTLLKEVGA